jgi:hypothetical protein
VHDVGAETLDRRSSASAPWLKVPGEVPALPGGNGDECAASVEFHGSSTGPSRIGRDHDDVDTSLQELSHQAPDCDLRATRGFLSGGREV